MESHRIFYRGLALAAFFVFLIMPAKGESVNILFDNTDSQWESVTLEYRLLTPDGSDAIDELHQVGMDCIGQNLWVYRIDAPTAPRDLYFSGNGLRCGKSNLDGLWDDLVFSYRSGAQTAQTKNARLIFFDFHDIHSWIASGNFSHEVFSADTEDTSLFDAWAKKSFIPDSRLLTIGEPHSSDGHNIYPMALFFTQPETPVSKPCLWIYDALCPSNSAVAPLYDGVAVIPSHETCSRSMYASYMVAGSVAYDMSGFPVPFRSGNFTLDWIAPRKDALIAFTLTPGSEASFMQGGLIPDASSAVTSGSRSDFEFSIPDGSHDPSIKYSALGLPDSYPSRVAVAVQFSPDTADKGNIRFSLLPPKAIEWSFVQESTASTHTALILKLTPEGRDLRQQIQGIRIASDNPSALSELTRAMGLQVRNDNPEIIISDETIINSLKAGTAVIDLGLIRPDRDYRICVTPICGGATDDDYPLAEADMLAAQPFRVQIGAPEVALLNTAVIPMDLSQYEATALSASVDLPEGNDRTIYTRAASLEHTFAFGQATGMPRGWSSRCCLIEPDGTEIATEQTSLTLTGLDPARSALRFRAIHTSPEGHEICSPDTWLTEDLLPMEMPILLPTKGNEIFQRSGAESEFGIAYDYILELNHRTYNPLGMPFYVGYSTACSNAAWHQGHGAAGSDPSVRLMTAAEVYSSEAADCSISGNEGITAANPHQWGAMLARNDRTVLYFTHFHCENPQRNAPHRAPSAATDYAAVTARLHTYVPILYNEHPLTGENATTRAADSGRKLLVLKNPATDAPASLSFEVPVDRIDNIATFAPQPVSAPEAHAQIRDLLGRPLPRIPQSGYFIINRMTFRK